MANPFLAIDSKDVETAILLEKAKRCDIGQAVAFTDGDRIFLNTEDNLFNILPAYDEGMLKWLLWHEEYHKQLRHHNRFFKFLEELSDKKTKETFGLTKEEVNIIMDILVHDSLCKLFPELVETAKNNLAQMRNRNSLGYTFKTNTLEEMLKEYADFKKTDKEDDEGEGEPEDKDDDSKDKPKDGSGTGVPDDKKDDKKDKEDGKSTKEHGEGGKGEKGSEHKEEDKEPEIKDEPEPEPEHDKTDWSKLDNIDSKEFIEKNEGDYYEEQIAELKKKKFRLGKLTETLNGLATTTRRRSYAMPSTIHVGKGVLLKGRVPGKTNLFLCFDASGSMGDEMQTFKDIISKSIPQAMDVPTTWFSGYPTNGWSSIEHLRDKNGRNSDDYYRSKFKDFMQMRASAGYSDDGDRTIEMCLKAEQEGYSPIGVTDGGGQIGWSRDMIKKLSRTVLVGQNEHWLKTVQKINPKIQIIVV